jgi:hypothetical protein
MVVYTVIDDRSVSKPLGDAVDTFVRREDAESFFASVRRDDRSSRHIFGSASESSRRAATTRSSNDGIACVTDR